MGKHLCIVHKDIWTKVYSKEEPSTRTTHRPLLMEVLSSLWRERFHKQGRPITFSLAGFPTHSCWEEPGCIFFHLSARRKPIQRGKLSEGRLEVLIWSLSRRLLRPPLLQMVLSRLCGVASSSCCAKIEPQFTKVHGRLSRQNATSDISIREEMALDYCPGWSRAGALFKRPSKHLEWSRMNIQNRHGLFPHHLTCQRMVIFAA